MSHGDRVTQAAARLLSGGASARTRRSPSPSTSNRQFYSTMFHPEVVHTPDGAKLLRNFTHKIAGMQGRLDDGGVQG